MVEDPLNPGFYYMRQRFQAGVTDIPATIDVQGLTVSLVDEINISLVRYNVGTDQIVIHATSSDLSNPPVLTAFDQAGREIGQLVDGVLTATLEVSPSAVTVKSSRGGSTTQIVDDLGGNQVGN
jgi:hypothetical protein